MEKLPEKWFIIPTTKEECKVIGRWFDVNKKGVPGMGDHFYENRLFVGADICVNYGWGRVHGAIEITFDQFKRLVLRETEEWEPKDGDYIIRTWPSGHTTLGICANGRFKSLENYPDEGGVRKGETYGEAKQNYKGIPHRPARPEEIPREAYEAQQKVGTEEIDCPECNGEGRQLEGKLYPNGHTEEWVTCKKCNGDGYIETEKVNKCSTINKKENGTEESERSETEINLETDTRAEGGKDVRSRTKSVRNLCESGSIESGNEVNRSRKHRKRLIPERGETYI